MDEGNSLNELFDVGKCNFHKYFNYEFPHIIWYNVNCCWDVVGGHGFVNIITSEVHTYNVL